MASGVVKDARFPMLGVLLTPARMTPSQSNGEGFLALGVTQ